MPIIHRSPQRQMVIWKMSVEGISPAVAPAFTVLRHNACCAFFESILIEKWPQYKADGEHRQCLFILEFSKGGRG